MQRAQIKALRTLGADFGDNPALIEKADPVSQIHNAQQVMAHDQNCRALIAKATTQGIEIGGSARIES
jgi:hypothetical protein